MRDFHIGDRVLFVDSGGGSEREGEECVIIEIGREESVDGYPLDDHDYVSVRFDDGEESWGWFAYRFKLIEQTAQELPSLNQDVSSLLFGEVES